MHRDAGCQRRGQCVGPPSPHLDSVFSALPAHGFGCGLSQVAQAQALDFVRARVDARARKLLQRQYGSSYHDWLIGLYEQVDKVNHPVAGRIPSV